VEAETRYHPTPINWRWPARSRSRWHRLPSLSRLHASHVEDVQTWSSLDDIGIFGISVAEEQGGSGLGAAEEALIVMALGQRLVAPAVLATIGAAHAPAARALRGFAGGGPRLRIVVALAQSLWMTPLPTSCLWRDRGDAALYELAFCTLQPVDDRLVACRVARRLLDRVSWRGRLTPARRLPGRDRQRWLR